MKEIAETREPRSEHTDQLDQHGLFMWLRGLAEWAARAKREWDAMPEPKAVYEFWLRDRIERWPLPALSRDAGSSAEAQERIDAREQAVPAALSLLARCVMYAREDRMQTPGSTRLARALAEAERLLADTQVVPKP